MSRRLRVAIVALVGVAAIGYVNFGFFHAVPRQQIHYWDAFHYFVGAKYLPELGYARLYEATYVAGRELGAFAGIERLPDLPTYQARDVRSIDAAAVRGRFSDARWRAFNAGLKEWTTRRFDKTFSPPPAP